MNANGIKAKIKCVVWDLDNTIWDGILPEGDHVCLKPGIKQVVQSLDERGILHSIASKNFYDDAKLKLKEFGLWDYFLYPEINWNAKSVSIETIQKNLNIGMDTLMFIDDQPFEREEVHSVHPEITCFDASHYIKIPDLPRLKPEFVTPESRNRRLMYQQNQARQAGESYFQGLRREFLESLHIELTIAPAQEDDLYRAEELTVRTNQLNATGVTYSRKELEHLMLSEKYILLMCKLTDKYGSLGNVGMSLIEITPQHYHIRLLLMSCRVMSLGLGSILLTYIQHEAKQAGKTLLADFKHTDRNRNMFVAFKFANFTRLKSQNEITLLQNDLSFIPNYPEYIQLMLPD